MLSIVIMYYTNDLNTITEVKKIRFDGGDVIEYILNLLNKEIEIESKYPKRKICFVGIKSEDGDDYCFAIRNLNAKRVRDQINELNKRGTVYYENPLAMPHIYY